jgi:hypothetical protein
MALLSHSPAIGARRMSSTPDATFESVVAIIARNQTQADKVYPTGARLICRLPWIAEHAWLHRIFAPCSEDAIASLPPSTGRQPPRELVAFLHCANGMWIFNESLSIYGVRGTFTRDPEAAAVLPFDLANHHREKAHLYGAEDFLVGSCGPDGNLCVWRATDGRIDRLNQTGGRVLESWPSFHDWLVQETERLAACHDVDGRLLEPRPDQTGKAKPRPQKHLASIRPRRWSPAWWWDLEKRLNLPINTLPLGWLSKLQVLVLRRLEKWLNRK